ncbi:MAG: polysaccharide deacetylase family protein [Firmicutes bacterium]|nr:polysaccharide deacetylase family protein [Bacillota bacterium]
MIILHIRFDTLRRMAVVLGCLGLVVFAMSLSPKILPAAVSGQKPVYAVEREDNTIALSFDASWGAEHTEELLNILEEHDVKTTFFLVDLWIEEYPDLVRTIDEKGHEIGLHSHTHPRFTELTTEQMEKELSANQEAIAALTDKRATLFRPPYGDYNDTVIATASAMGLTTVQWSVDSLDWQGLDADAITDRVMDGVAPGAIVLMHNNGEHTAEALKQLITKILKKGYTIVPVGELL